MNREIEEELGEVTILKTIPIETFTSKDQKFKYYTYFCVVDCEFIPKLNGEHSGYAWAGLGDWPQPLHQGVRKTLNDKIIQQKLETIFYILEN